MIQFENGGFVRMKREQAVKLGLVSSEVHGQQPFEVVTEIKSLFALGIRTSVTEAPPKLPISSTTIKLGWREIENLGIRTNVPKPLPTPSVSSTTIKLAWRKKQNQGTRTIIPKSSPKPPVLSTTTKFECRKEKNQGIRTNIPKPPPKPPVLSTTTKLGCRKEKNLGIRTNVPKQTPKPSVPSTTIKLGWKKKRNRRRVRVRLENGETKRMTKSLAQKLGLWPTPIQDQAGVRPQNLSSQKYTTNVNFSQTIQNVTGNGNSNKISPSVTTLSTAHPKTSVIDQTSIQEIKSRTIPVSQKIREIKSRTMPVPQKIREIKSRTIPVSQRVQEIKSRVIPISQDIQEIKIRSIPFLQKIQEIKDRSIPVSQEIQEIKNRSIPVSQDQSITFNIPRKYYTLLTNDTGQHFTQLVRTTLNVSVILDQSNVNCILCTLNGPAQSLDKAQLAIENYCFDGGKIISFATELIKLDDLRNNLERLSFDISWYSNALGLYENINKIVLKVKNVCCDEQFQEYVKNLQYLYTKLNTIIIGKLRLGKDKEHMEILENGNRSIEELKESFSYVFNRNRIIYPNYEELINTLPHCNERSEMDIQQLKYELPLLRRRALMMCSKYDWLKKHDYFMTQYLLIVINNYPDCDVLTYKSKFDELQKHFAKHEHKLKEKMDFELGN